MGLCVVLHNALIFTGFCELSNVQNYKNLLCSLTLIKIQKYFVNRLNYFIKYFYIAFIELRSNIV